MTDLAIANGSSDNVTIKLATGVDTYSSTDYGTIGDTACDVALAQNSLTPGQMPGLPHPVVAPANADIWKTQSDGSIRHIQSGAGHRRPTSRTAARSPTRPNAAS